MRNAVAIPLPSRRENRSSIVLHYSFRNIQVSPIIHEIHQLSLPQSLDHFLCQISFYSMTTVKAFPFFSLLKFLLSLFQSKRENFRQKHPQYTIKCLFAFLCNDFQYHHNLFLIPSCRTECESVGCRKWQGANAGHLQWRSCGQLGWY